MSTSSGRAALVVQLNYVIGIFMPAAIMVLVCVIADYEIWTCAEIAA